MSKKYLISKNIDNLKKIEQMIIILPKFCESYFIGIQQRTSPLTRLNYAHDLHIFFNYVVKIKFKNSIDIKELTCIDLEKLDIFDLDSYLNYLNSYSYNNKMLSCGEATKERKISSVRSLFKFLYNRNLIKENVASKTSLPKKHFKEIVRLEVNEVSALLNVVESGDLLSKNILKYRQNTESRDFALITLFLGTGIRISELIGLDKDDINLSNNSFKIIRKGGNESILYFSDEVAEALSKYLNWLDEQNRLNTKFAKKITDKNALFVSSIGNRISPRAIQNLVGKYCKLITPLKNITPHKLRSTFGTSLYRETQDIYIVADVLGHKDINTTKKHYAAISDDIRRKASNKVILRDNKD